MVTSEVDGGEEQGTSVGLWWLAESRAQGHKTAQNLSYNQGSNSHTLYRHIYVNAKETPLITCRKNKQTNEGSQDAGDVVLRLSRANQNFRLLSRACTC